MDDMAFTQEETASDIELLHEIGSRMAAADPFHEVLERVIEMVTAAVRCDSCFLYVLEKEKLVLRASKNLAGPGLRPDDDQGQSISILQPPICGTLSLPDAAQPCGAVSQRSFSWQ